MLIYSGTVKSSKYGNLLSNAQRPQVSSDISLDEFPLFEKLSAPTLAYLGQHLVQETYRPDESFFQSLEPADCIFLVKSGKVDVAMDWQGERIRLNTAGPADVIGVFPVIGTSVRSTTAVACEDCSVYRLPSEAFLRIREFAPRDFDELEEGINGLLLKIQLKLALRISTLFQGLEDFILLDLEKALKMVSLPGNTVLCTEGSPAEEIFIVISGRLQISRGRGKNFALLGEVGCGETVGELGVISRDLRAADVTAIRDSTVAVLSASAFEELLAKHPLQMNRSFVTSIVGHLTGAHKRVRNSANTFAVVCLSREISEADVSSRLADAFQAFGGALVIDSQRCDASLGGAGIAQSSFDSPINSSLLQWCAQQEMSHRYVIYTADHENTPWTYRCLRQADHVIFVGAGAGDSGIGSREQEILEDSSVDNSKKTLVLLHEKDVSVPTGTIEWIKRRNNVVHHHARIDVNEDFERIARFLTGRAVGLVLGGGGARGFAHIGVIRALAELNIPVDIVGGNSMGAIIAAQCAMGWLPKEMIERTVPFCVKGEEFTLPLVSLFRGRRMYRGFNSMYGEAQVEDLWKKFFSVSCNLSRACVMTHETGLLSTAVLNSNSPPGLVPPQVVDGDLLVDGALLNNIPVDVMRRFNPAGPVIAVDVSAREDLLNNTSLSGGASGFGLLLRKMIPSKRKEIRFPGITEILARASTIGGVAAQKRMMDGLADCYLTPPVSRYANMAYKHGDGIAGLGYEYARDRLSEWKGRA